MLALPDLPPQLQETAICGISAAYEYGIPANVLLAVAQAEGGRPGQWVGNTNGTYDIGRLQFNTAYLATLAGYGITPAMAAQRGCYPYQLAAWRLRYELKTEHGDVWTRAACYHSKTPYYNAIYRQIIIRYGAFWQRWLETHFVTRVLGTPGLQRPAGIPVRLITQPQPAKEEIK
jgi:hypothetical protein